MGMLPTVGPAPVPRRRTRGTAVGPSGRPLARGVRRCRSGLPLAPCGPWDDARHVRRPPLRARLAAGVRGRGRGRLRRIERGRRGGGRPPRHDAGQRRRDADAPDDLKIPANVPLRSTGPASKTATRIIRRWLAALDRGDIERAARFFALPSKFQNAGTPVLHIDSEAERIAVNLSLTCGARAEETGGAGAYTIVQFRLTERKGPGAGCGPGTGGTARGAILVVGGRIHEWYRLPDDELAEPDQVQASGPSA